MVKLKTQKENTWLLIKKKDKFAIDSDILEENKSVISNLTLEAFRNKKNLIVKVETNYCNFNEKTRQSQSQEQLI